MKPSPNPCLLFRERNPTFLRKHYDPSWTIRSLIEDQARRTASG